MQPLPEELLYALVCESGGVPENTSGWITRGLVCNPEVTLNLGTDGCGDRRVSLRMNQASDIPVSGKHTPQIVDQQATHNALCWTAMQWATTGQQGQQYPESPVSWIRERCADRVNGYIKTVFASALNLVPGCMKGGYSLTAQGAENLADANGISVQQQQQQIVKENGAPAAKGQPEVGIKTLTAQGVENLADANGISLQQQQQQQLVKEVGVPAAKGQTLTAQGVGELADANGISVQQQQQQQIVKKVKYQQPRGRLQSRH